MATEDSKVLNDLQSILRQKTPLMPLAKLRSFVAHYFSCRDKYLAILEQYPPPVYVLESDVLKEKARQFQEAFKRVLPEVYFYYAVKSNNNPEVSKILLQSNFGLDVSSGLELKMALNLNAHDIVFSGPGKTDQELTLASLHAEQVTVLMDSFSELHRLEAIAASRNKRVRAGVRLTTNPNGLWRKFGILPHTLPAFWKEAGQCPHVMLQGLQFHTSWNLSPEAQIDFIRVLGKLLAEKSGLFRKEIRFIDIGGGYWPPQGEWLQSAGTPEGRIRSALGKGVDPNGNHYCFPASPIESFADELGLAIREHLCGSVSCRICLEPGRWICNDAMHLFISVVDKKAAGSGYCQMPVRMPSAGSALKPIIFRS